MHNNKLALKQKKSLVVSLWQSQLTFVWPGIPKQPATIAQSSQSERHLMVFVSMRLYLAKLFIKSIYICFSQFNCFDNSIQDFSPFQKPFWIFEIYQHLQVVLLHSFLVFCQKLSDLWKFRIFLFRNFGCWIFKLKMFVYSKYCEVHVYYMQVKPSRSCSDWHQN